MAGSCEHQKVDEKHERNLPDSHRQVVQWIEMLTLSLQFAISKVSVDGDKRTNISHLIIIKQQDIP